MEHSNFEPLFVVCYVISLIGFGFTLGMFLFFLFNNKKYGTEHINSKNTKTKLLTLFSFLNVLFVSFLLYCTQTYNLDFKDFEILFLVNYVLCGIQAFYLSELLTFNKEQRKKISSIIKLDVSSPLFMIIFWLAIPISIFYNLNQFKIKKENTKTTS